MSRFSDVTAVLRRPGDATAELLAPRRPEPEPARLAEAPNAARLLGAPNADFLTDAETLGLVLSCAQRGRDTGDLAARALAQFGSFARLLAAPERELRTVPGFGTHTIAALRLLHEAAIRFGREGLARRRLLDEPRHLYNYLSTVLARERIEQFRILFLDGEDALILDEAQARGTVNHTPVYPREVVRRALELDAASLVLVHNHPSGDPTPSSDDLDMTRQIAEAAGTMEIGVRDHVIVGNGKHFSFRAEGLLG